MNHIDRNVMILTDGFEDVVYKRDCESQMNALQAAVKELGATKERHYLHSTNGEMRLLVSKERADEFRARLAAIIDEQPVNL